MLSEWGWNKGAIEERAQCSTLSHSRVILCVFLLRTLRTLYSGRHLIKAIMLSCFNKESLQQSCFMCAPSYSTVVKTPRVLAQVGANGWIWAGRCGLCDTSADVTKWNSMTFLLLRNVWSHGRPGCPCGTLRGPHHILGTDGRPRVVSQWHFQF